MKKVVVTLLAVLLLIGVLLPSCSKNKRNEKESGSQPASESEAEYDDGLAHDRLPKRDYDKAEFIIYTYENDNMLFPTMSDEDSDDVVVSAEYKAKLAVEERFNIDIEEVIVTDKLLSVYSTAPQSGVYEYDVGNCRCIYTLTLYSNDLIHTFEELEYVDLSREYWNQTANETLTIGGVQYAAVGGYSVATYSLAHVLLFNKGLVADLKLQDPYQLVKDNEWTMDNFYRMLGNGVIKDLNGDSRMDGEDRYGILAHYKEILPSFWLGFDTYSIAKDDEDVPYLNITSEKFIDVFNKVLDYTFTSGAWYKGDDWELDIPEFCVRMFSSNQALFMDSTFFALERLRGSEDITFGILPYPKWDDAQKDYRTRVEYYNSFVVPVGVEDVERAGFILEALNCEYYNKFVPAYYDVALQRKYTRDDESAEMLDIIFNTFVMDLGDTALCGYVRDGFLAAMYLGNNRDIASMAAKAEPVINKAINDALK